MDRIREYSKSDYPEICEWFTAHGMPSPAEKFLPALGYTVPGVAAGFVYTTDSAVCILDCFISNPSSEKRLRDTAIDLITLKLLHAAKLVGGERVLCSTQHVAVRDRALKLGFDLTGEFYSLGKEL